MKSYSELAEIFFLKKKQTHSQHFHVKQSLLHLFIQNVIQVLFPHCYPHLFETPEDLSLRIQRNELQLYEILKDVLPHPQAQNISHKFTQELETINALLDKDAQAIFNGDPAAKTLEEVVLSYPGFFAIAVHRISHFFYTQHVPTVPRIISEYAHQKTGVDIHPGASIGESFCMDHATGIVIGETTIIGNNVKIYQGVTLGALSVDKSHSQTKRHPTIEDHCVIYANATILGGETHIGKNSIIGGNVWLTKSVPPESIVYHKSDLQFESKKGS